MPRAKKEAASTAPKPRLAPVTTATMPRVPLRPVACRPVYGLIDVTPSTQGGDEDVLDVAVRSQGLEAELAAEP